MINWHRRMWRLAPITHEGIASNPILFKESGSNVFWLEPKKTGKAEPDTFTVCSLPDAMTRVWKNREVFRKGKNPFRLDTEPDDETERLESGPFKVPGLQDKRLLCILLAPHPSDPQNQQCIVVLLKDAEGNATSGMAAGGHTGHPP